MSFTYPICRCAVNWCIADNLRWAPNAAKSTCVIIQSASRIARTKAAPIARLVVVFQYTSTEECSCKSWAACTTELSCGPTLLLCAGERERERVGGVR